jgi:hypothetical protein
LADEERAELEAEKIIEKAPDAKESDSVADRKKFGLPREIRLPDGSRVRLGSAPRR